ncbi:hypothetical protein GC163_15115 [bacterium]|nr:hypothetical protein [bacterium]
MASPSQTLASLHQLQLRLKEVQDEIARGPRHVQVRRTQVQKREAELGESRDRLKQQKVLADQKNLQLKTNEAKIADLRTKLNVAASNREYEIITGQIAADTMANSVLEDEILEALTKVDQFQIEMKQAEEKVKQAEDELKQIIAQVEAKEPGLKEQETSLKASVAKVEMDLPSDIMPQYRRTAQALGADALAAVENKVCTSCYVQLTSQRMVELRSGKLIFCTCGRLMYLPKSETEN